MNSLKKLQKNPKFQKAFTQLGASWLVTDELYSHARMKSVDAVRAKMLQKMVGADKVLDSKVDLECLPPPKVCLIPHASQLQSRLLQESRPTNI